jgi:hypothetical protein
LVAWYETSFITLLLIKAPKQCELFARLQADAIRFRRECPLLTNSGTVCPKKHGRTACLALAAWAKQPLVRRTQQQLTVIGTHHTGAWSECFKQCIGRIAPFRKERVQSKYISTIMICPSCVSWRFKRSAALKLVRVNLASSSTSQHLSQLPSCRSAFHSIV